MLFPKSTLAALAALSAVASAQLNTTTTISGNSTTSATTMTTITTMRSNATTTTGFTNGTTTTTSAGSSGTARVQVLCADGQPARSPFVQVGSDGYFTCPNTDFTIIFGLAKRQVSPVVAAGADPNVQCAAYCSSLFSCVAVTYTAQANGGFLCVARTALGAPIAAPGTTALILVVRGLTPVGTTSAPGPVSTVVIGTAGGVGIVIGGTTINNNNNIIIGTGVSGIGSGIGSGLTIGIGGSNGGSNGGNNGQQGVLTVYSTTLVTITSCAATVTNCPATISTSVVSLYTTVCPLTSTNGFVPAAYVVSSAYATSTFTVTACPATVTNCPVGQTASTSVLSAVNVVPVSSGVIPGASAAAAPAKNVPAANNTVQPPKALQAGAANLQLQIGALLVAFVASVAVFMA